MHTILVTGATSGIGRAMAITLQAAGYAVIATGRKTEALASLAAEAPEIETLALDLSDRDAVTRALSGHRIDVLINNAGMMPTPGRFDTMAQDEIDRTFDVNLTNVLFLTRLLVPGMKARGAGHVIFTGSSAAHAPGAGFAAYAASKAGIAAFATALRAELSPNGIRVTELVPGRVETGLYAGVLGAEERDAMYGDGNSLQPQDIADVVLALLKLPARADVTRVDLMPTRPVPPIKLK
ncbi:SDR family oxidoreductase [Pararhodobacter sp. CCB-MM2]|uniref:SDR family oxidoreductase n=1 Tax=Pararhodobacter sp. CCB-MM2 TaxID=1786003 RepID=UPI000837336F|nr:SDR family oxidoreductase [Pararhodobacter sp. CCB-MM2]